MLARFFTEDLRGNKTEHIMPYIGADYAESELSEKGCQRLTIDADKNYYTVDGVDKDYARQILDNVFENKNISIPVTYIFEEHAKDSV